jgi:multiple sugar transport system substrate-binding protein
MNSFGGGWGNGTTINSPENVAALDYIFKMFKEGLAVQARDLGLSWDGEVFAAGKAAMTTAGAWYNGFMAEAAPNTNYEVIAMPGGNGHNGSSLHSTGFAVLNTSKHPDVAAKAAMYMARAEAQKEMANTAGYQPSLMSLQEWYYTQNKDGPRMAKTRTSLDSAVSFGYPVRMVEFESDLARAIDEVVLNGATTTSQQILDTLAAKYGILE